MDELICQLLSTDVVFVTNAQEVLNLDSARRLTQKVNKAWFAAF